MDELPPRLKPITVRVREACQLTGIGRSKLYMLIAEGHIETVKVGSMTLIPMRGLEAFLLGGARSGPSPQPLSIHANPEDWDEDARRWPPKF